MDHRLALLLVCCASTLLAAGSRAQGSDDCAGATLISGPGTFTVSTVGATDSPQQSGSCVVAHNDVWLQWTATQSGLVLFRTCGGVSVDSVIAVYAGGGCPLPGALLACNDDACALQSSVSFSATVGSTYLLQLGAYGAATTYSGTFTLTFPAPSANDSCASPLILSGSGPFAFDTTQASTGAEGQANPLCGTPAGIDRDVWFMWTASATTSIEVRLCGGASFDTKLAVYAGSGCPGAAALACNDDACGLQSLLYFNAVAGNTYTIQLGSYPGAASGTGTFTVAPGSGGCPSPSSGPDVIVGSISSILNTSASGGLDAFAIGMGACNVGDAVLAWFAGSNQHPVIGANLYRYKVVDGAGRLEQVGMSWLKHGFAAATENLCCPCQNPGNSQLLGVGCADTYSAGLNGNQAALGPRWQVNASSGVFAYPPANPGWSGPTARRCEVALPDLESGGVTRYFSEGVYVTADDAAAGNGDNNASWREVSVTGGPLDFTFALTGGTVRMQTAVEAWAGIEPGVTLSDVRVPGDGRLIVGSHATNLGGGLYRYEYAVYNMSSDRNVGTFSVPIPAGATLTNIGFHDVTYRNGDGPGSVNVADTDWPATLAGGVLTWATETEAQNPRANAIRWATTYNFRFDADSAPASGGVALGLWKSGSPGSIAATAEVPAGGGAGLAVCLGDGTGTACPCGNESPVGAGLGCLNSLGTGGGLTTSGTASVVSDSLVLHGSGMPDSSALYFQGSAQAAGGAGIAFGDGLRCASGTVVRLGVKTNALGVSQYPAVGDAAISVRGLIVPGDVRTYQCWYRNAATFCQPETFNLTNGFQVTWQM